VTCNVTGPVQQVIEPGQKAKMKAKVRRIYE